MKRDMGEITLILITSLQFSAAQKLAGCRPLFLGWQNLNDAHIKNQFKFDRLPKPKRA